MRYVFFVMACGCALGLGSIAMAEDRAATDQLPAALQELDGASDSLVTQSEAREVRGTYLYGLNPYEPSFTNYLNSGWNSGYYGSPWETYIRPYDSPGQQHGYSYGGVYWAGDYYVEFSRTIQYDSWGREMSDNSWSRPITVNW